LIREPSPAWKQQERRARSQASPELSKYRVKGASSRTSGVTRRDVWLAGSEPLIVGSGEAVKVIISGSLAASRATSLRIECAELPQTSLGLGVCAVVHEMASMTEDQVGFVPAQTAQRLDRARRQDGVPRTAKLGR
jgi:hypothetical protein